MSVVREAFLRVSDVSQRASRRAIRQYGPHDHRQGRDEVRRPDIGRHLTATAGFEPAHRRSPGQPIFDHAFDNPAGQNTA